MLKGIWQRERRKKTLWTVAAGLAVVVLAVTATVFFKENQDLKKSPDAAARATSERVLEKVSKLYQLPNGEQPTVAKIEDKSKLEGQSFFKTAENGDYLLVYPKAKLALLYRENDDRLVNVGPVNTDRTSNVAGEQTEQTE